MSSCRSLPEMQGWGSSLSKVTKFLFFGNFLVVKFHLKSNLVPQIMNFSPTKQSQKVTKRKYVSHRIRYIVTKSDNACIHQCALGHK